MMTATALYAQTVQDQEYLPASVPVYQAIGRGLSTTVFDVSSDKAHEMAFSPDCMVRATAAIFACRRSMDAVASVLTVVR